VHENGGGNAAETIYCKPTGQQMWTLSNFSPVQIGLYVAQKSPNLQGGPKNEAIMTNRH